MACSKAVLCVSLRVSTTLCSTDTHTHSLLLMLAITLHCLLLLFCSHTPHHTTPHGECCVCLQCFATHNPLPKPPFCSNPLCLLVLRGAASDTTTQHTTAHLMHCVGGVCNHHHNIVFFHLHSAFLLVVRLCCSSPHHVLCVTTALLSTTHTACMRVWHGTARRVHHQPLVKNKNTTTTTNPCLSRFTCHPSTTTNIIINNNSNTMKELKTSLNNNNNTLLNRMWWQIECNSQACCAPSSTHTGIDCCEQHVLDGAQQLLTTQHHKHCTTPLSSPFVLWCIFFFQCHHKQTTNNTLRKQSPHCTLPKWQHAAIQHPTSQHTNEKEREWHLVGTGASGACQ